MKIVFSASQSELKNSAELIRFFDHAVHGMSTDIMEDQARKAETADGSYKLEIELPELYVTGLTELVCDKYRDELFNVIRGALGLVNGFKGLMHGFCRDFSALVRLTSSMAKSKESIISDHPIKNCFATPESERPFRYTA